MFIKKNKDRWITYQTQPAKTPDEAADRFTTIMDDVGYAQTFYPRSSLGKWLNSLAAAQYQSIYKNKKGQLSQIIRFWKYDLPALFYKYQKTFIFTSILFLFFTMLGVLASIKEPDFLSSILGSQYVDETERRIANGDPFGVYKDEHPFTMFIRIAFNNIKVAMMTFLGGFTLGIFTFKMMFDTGLMFGSFHQMFFAHGLGLKSILVVWIHGVLEISSIIVAATAGFVLAKSILFRGTYTRMQSLRRGGKNAAKIMIALIPLFVVASFLESYVTHLMSAGFDAETNLALPVWAAVIIIALSMFFIIWYFIIWPIILHKKNYRATSNDILTRLIIKDA